MATIVGITGAIGSGKSTVSHFLTELEPQSALYESGLIIAELANAFNQALSSELSFEVAGNDVELINQALIWFTESINEQLGYNVTWNQLAITKHRLAAHPAYYDKILAYIQQLRANPQLATTRITPENKQDYRTLLQWLGGYLVATIKPTLWFDEIFRRVDRYDNDKRLVIINGLRYPSDAETVREHDGIIIEITRPSATIVDANDITEVERTKINADTTITNSGSLDDLKHIIERLWQDISISKLADTYP
jgi:cytidylate kinase